MRSLSSRRRSHRLTRRPRTRCETRRPPRPTRASNCTRAHRARGGRTRHGHVGWLIRGTRRRGRRPRSSVGRRGLHSMVTCAPIARGCRSLHRSSSRTTMTLGWTASITSRRRWHRPRTAPPTGGPRAHHPRLGASRPTPSRPLQLAHRDGCRPPHSGQRRVGCLAHEAVTVNRHRALSRQPRGVRSTGLAALVHHGLR